MIRVAKVVLACYLAAKSLAPLTNRQRTPFMAIRPILFSSDISSFPFSAKPKLEVEEFRILLSSNIIISLKRY